ncbi:hypothetical protein ONS96_000479 [Cadophora gregata f. sp. sojae]|nr:hypothetical protein ONS96_000479 [Cadophora gregata f. sp. sojae]
MASVKLGVNYEWKFICGHIMRHHGQIAAQSASLSNSSGVTRILASENCVYCKHFNLADNVNQSDTQTYKNDRQALKIYESQVETIEQHIEDAGDNASLVKNMEKLLEQCNLMWAEEVKKMEKRESNSLIQPGHPASLSTALLEKFDTALSKVKLLERAEKILLKRAQLPSYKGQLTAARLESRCQKLNDYHAKLKRFMWTALGIGSWNNVISAEERLDCEWAGVVDLMNAD